MGKSPNGYKDRMRDDCVAILVRLIKCRRVSIEDLAQERGLSARSVYRWVRSFSFIMPVEVKGGVAVVGDEHFHLERLNQLKIFPSSQKNFSCHDATCHGRVLRGTGTHSSFSSRRDVPRARDAPPDARKGRERTAGEQSTQERPLIESISRSSSVPRPPQKPKAERREG